MAWATTGDVTVLTGVDVGYDQVDLAQGVIEIYSGTTEDAVGITARDLRFLRYAVAYQAAWMFNQVDVFTRTDVTRVRQDGVEFNQASEDALILAPLAKRCLERLSWRKPRALRVRGSQWRWRNHAQYAASWMRDGYGTSGVDLGGYGVDEDTDSELGWQVAP